MAKSSPVRNAVEMQGDRTLMLSVLYLLFVLKRNCYNEANLRVTVPLHIFGRTNLRTSLMLLQQLLRRLKAERNSSLRCRPYRWKPNQHRRPSRWRAACPACSNSWEHQTTHNPLHKRLQLPTVGLHWG